MALEDDRKEDKNVESQAAPDQDMASPARRFELRGCRKTYKLEEYRGFGQPYGRKVQYFEGPSVLHKIQIRRKAEANSSETVGLFYLVK